MAEYGRELQFALFSHIERSSGSAALSQLYDEHLEFLTRAEQAGFYAFHLAEHHSTPLSMTPSPSLFLAAASQRTRRLRLGAMVYLLPFYNPLRLINEICMLDHLCAGRLEVGVGRGISPFEHALFGTPVLESRELFAEAFEVVLKGLTHPVLHHRGEYFRFTQVPLELRPMQTPHPPLWYGGMAERNARFAAEQGMNLAMIGPTALARQAIAVYREALEQPNHAKVGSGPRKAAIMRLIYVAPTDREAEEIAAAAHKTHVANIQKLWVHFGVDDRRTNHDYPTARQAGTIIAGSPTQVASELGSQLEQCRANYLMCNMKFGSLDASQSLASLELFATRVMPALRV
ncbi:MAG TPA: LLM class flavin-dependent oxidoreductase [Candidatus Binataceae bacterium]|nr:LLM class flavin-dependent oxidoreductase [Candidatus Binataceae bacterium]